ncbi:MAG: aminotransferase class I/II-fold pyridoxal phosphate-dependent enzyme [Bacteroidetes bacterium]|nr:aminotransferase class I/II-fold pyridoxal phosphate-dependent enzyme [Bacteroidota bacterium]
MSTIPVNEFMLQALQQRESEGALRALRIPGETVDFCSNDYYGFARSVEFSERINSAAGALASGSGGSRLLAGNSLFTEEAEREIAGIFEAETALIYSSGYAANLGFFQALGTRQATVLYDEYIHASVRDGIRLSMARAHHFAHNDVNDLRQKLARCSGLVFVAVEAVYSMDGDEAPLAEIAACCRLAGASLVVDEAHSTGVYFPGLTAERGLHAQVFARLHTFGKAGGVHGAVWTGSALLRNYLINFSRPFIYTTAPSPHSVAAMRYASREMKQQQPQLKQLLRNRIAYFRRQAELFPSLQLLPSHSAIQALLVPGNLKARQAAEHLQQHGFDVRPVLAPTVPEGTERIRVCIHTHNTEQEINDFLKCASLWF